MCKEVIRQARIKKVYYLVKSNFNNEDRKNIEYSKFDKNPQIINTYKEKLSQFFASKR